MIENFEAKKVSRSLAWLVKLAGIVDPDGKTPIDLRMTFWGRKESARESFQQMLQWEPEKVILCHGRWYQENGTAEIRRAFRWLGNFSVRN
ncbi:hypothetical protein ACE1B6_23625 [Aerosakkonemataceae cyanobacterium BLCC-F154]|uniref:DUF4336 domain-containing protein n=1 Tax=Floridaenema fluviatile BLCC-F154 TaxID=3153640 RepID=A0ABV4YJI1_9CYAN